MKTLLLILLFAVGVLYGQQQVEYLFEKGNDLYKDGSYEKAIEVYESIVANDYESAELYYNLGNAYYKLRDMGHAILYYERARELAPGDADISHNLKLAELRVVDKVQSPPSFLQRTWQTVRDALALDYVAALTLFLRMVTSVVIILRLLMSRAGVQKWLRFVFSPVLILFVLSLCFFVLRLNYDASHDQAVVMSDRVEIKSSPTPDAQTVFALHEGVKVTITDQADQYYRIQLKDGKIGWLIQNAVEKI
ncbi:MAG: tetratricopeptide repeat protein [candidate division KSB1 bacterium]|nr:tetratricopeptide repeat protein [candidate division KSB1 bacterium]